MSHPTIPERIRYLWVRGPTYRYRDELRDMSGVWEGTESGWRLPWSQHHAAASAVQRWSGCTLHCLVPALPQPRPDKAFVRLRLLRVPLILNDRADLAVVGNWYDVEAWDGLCLCHPLREGARQAECWLCLESALDKHFESEV